MFDSDRRLSLIEQQRQRRIPERVGLGAPETRGGGGAIGDRDRVGVEHGQARQRERHKGACVRQACETVRGRPEV